jgi:hypothetical protein
MVSSCSGRHCKLGQVSADPKRAKFYRRLGGYAGRVVPFVQDAASEDSSDLEVRISRLGGYDQDPLFA